MVILPGFGRAVLEGCFQARPCGAAPVPAEMDAHKRYHTGDEPAVAGCVETCWDTVSGGDQASQPDRSVPAVRWSCVRPWSAWHLSLTLPLRCAGPFAQRPAPACCAQPGAELGSGGGRSLGPGHPRPVPQRFCRVGRKGAPCGAAAAPGAGGFFPSANNG